MINPIKQEDVMLTEQERLNAYRQMRSSIRNSEQYLVVGIDIAKEKHHAFFGTPAGKTICKQLIIKNDGNGYEQLLARTEQLRLQHQLKYVVFGMEPTANYHKPLAEYLIAREALVVLVSGTAVVRNRELLDNRWDKHDRKDAANVADLVGAGKCQFYDNPPQIILDLRELLGLRRRYRQLESGLRIRLRNNLLALHFPELDHHFSTHQHDCLSIIKTCFSPQAIAAMHFEKFCRKITDKPIRKRQQAFMEDIWTAAHKTVGRPVDETVQYMATREVCQLEQFRAEIEDLDRQIFKIASALPAYQYLVSIPGFGPFISAKILAAIDDPERFTNEAQVVKLAGFDLCASRSGKQAGKAIAQISKKGNAEIRFALYQAAMVATTKNTLFITYLNQKIQGREQEKGIQKKMRTKVAAKLLVIAWTLMKEHKYFNAEHLNLT
jgi:transposase